jgi:hypothetical protein
MQQDAEELYSALLNTLALNLKQVCCSHFTAIYFCTRSMFKPLVKCMRRVDAAGRRGAVTGVLNTLATNLRKARFYHTVVLQQDVYSTSAFHPGGR